ncbi:MAG: Asp-tRNA(Asn)/Glu-tRNA(Gln) amidotransferase subunit GatA [Phycisphaerae bacterium]|nr:Asp-tRNA(Asn)/Glu-tRNA(Gln) amidotransferase subunit GatA [Phycisphaerae bacterium]
MNPETMGVVEVREAVLSRRVTAREVAKAALGRLAAHADRLGLLTQPLTDRALEQAAEVDSRLASQSGDEARSRLPLAGVPIVVKDNLCTSFGRTTCASRMLEGYESPYSATAVARLLERGAVVLGKANLDEFAMGSSGEHSALGPTRNPWDPSRVPGGSSSGSAAAVAARCAAAALGSDTGGSIRQPAGHCGVVGLKPTYGRVSRYGLVAFASSLDQVGPLARSVEDAAAILDAISGVDPHDATSADRPHTDTLASIGTPVEGLTLGVPRQARGPGNHPQTARVFEQAVETFRGLGARVVDVDLPTIEHAIAAYYIVATAEASSNLARFDGVRYGRRAALGPDDGLDDLYSRSRSEGFGPEVRRRIMLGTHVLSSGYYQAYYATALKARRLVQRDFDRCFAAGCHAVLMPSSPGPAFRLGEKTSDPLAMYLEDVYTVGVNLAGLPGVSVPAGFARVDGVELPVGVQLIARAFDEGTLLRAARMFELANPAGRRAPP